MNKLTQRLISFIVTTALVFGGYNIAFASAAMLSGNTYYVSTTGNDSNPGSATAPFKTFAKAVSVLQAGDTLQVLAGTYTNPLTLATSGTQSAPINVIGNGAIIYMQGVNANGIAISGSYVNISKFEVTGAANFGIVVTGKYVTVEYNNIHDNVTSNGVGTCGISSSWGSALKVMVGGENTTLRGNTVYNNCGEGIAVTRGITALVENNTAYDNFSVNIYVDNSPFVTVQNNLSYCTGTHLRNGNRATGIALGEESYSGWGAQRHDILITGNTIKDCRNGVSAFDSNVGGTLTNLTITNNNIPSGQTRSISLQTSSNQNVMISYNTLFNDIYVNQPAGVTLTGNTIGSVAPTPTSSPLPTSTTQASPTPTFIILPSATATQAPVQASPTATQTNLPPTAPPTASLIPSSPTTVTQTIYDDKDSHFSYSAGWKNVTRKQAYSGSYKLTAQNGAYTTLTFNGQAFSVLYTGGSGYQKLNVYVDNVLVGTINENTSGFQLRWDYPGLLSAGSHTLKLVFVTNTSGTNGSIDAVIVH